MDALQLNGVFEPFEFMQDRLSFGTMADPSPSCGAWFRSRNMPIRHLIISSDSSFGFSLQISLNIWCSIWHLCACLLGFSSSEHSKNQKGNEKVEFLLSLFIYIFYEGLKVKSERMFLCRHCFE